MNKAFIKIQSTLSVTPPWPGIKFEKSLTFKFLLNALAIKPPKGATKLDINAIIVKCIVN